MDLHSHSNSKAVIVGVLGAVVVALSMISIAESPRSRLNVMQGVYVAFVSIVGIRWLFARRSTWREAAAPIERPTVILAFSLAAAVAAWLPALDSGFVSDDFGHLYAASQPQFSELWNLTRYGQSGTFLRPAGFASIFLDYRLFGNSAAGYHLTHLAIHFSAVVALYLCLKALGAPPAVSTTAAALFAAMPAQVEAVSWIGARFDVMATALTLWAMFCYLRFRAAGRPAMLAWAAVFYIGAMLSKESGFVLPLLLIAATVVMPGSRKSIRALPTREMGGLLGLGALGALVFVYRLVALGGIGGYPSGDRAAAVDIGLKTFEGLLLRGPSQLLSGINWEQPFSLAAILIAASLAGALMILALISTPTDAGRRFVRLGLLWILAAMAPAHFLLMVGAGMTNSRVLYMASAGVATVIGQLLALIPGKRLREALAVVLALGLAAGVVHNIGAWQHTAKLSQELLTEVHRLEPLPPAGAEFVFVGLPDTIRGVFFFHVGLAEGLRLTFGRNDIEARRAEEPARGSGPRIRFVWKQTPGVAIERQD